LTAARASSGKKECQVRLTGIEWKYWTGTEIGRLGGYGFRSTFREGDGSNQKVGKMRAGYMKLRGKKTKQKRKVGREEEGSSSNCPELATFDLSLRGTPVTTAMLYMLSPGAVRRWIGEGGKGMLVGEPDADILWEAIEELRKRATAGLSTFLVKVKAHREESAHDEVDIQAD